MPLPVRKSYTGNGVSTTLTSSPSDSNTTFTVAAVTGWPTSYPFYIVVDPGTSKEEKMRVTGISGLTVTVVRGQDDTTAVGHTSGAVAYPVFTADEADEANQIASAMTTKGDLIVTNGSDINRLAVGTNSHVLQADSAATNGVKWGQVATAGIADSAVTSAKIADGTIVNADISASAAIALTKLASGALPTTITVTSANIIGDAIATGDIADGAITSAKIADGTIVLADLAAALQAFLVPIGTITAYGGASAPTGWLLCDGSTFSAVTYPSLNTVLGGNTLPDLRGRFPMGKTAAGTGSTLLGTGGSTTIAEANLPAHTHTINHDHASVTSSGMSANATLTHSVTDPGHIHTENAITALGADGDAGFLGSLVDSTGNVNSGSASTGISIANHDVSHTHTVDLPNFTGDSGSVGSGTAYFQPFVAVNYIVKHD